MSFTTYLFCLHLLKQQLKWFGLILWSQIGVQRYFHVLRINQVLEQTSGLKFETLVSVKDKVTHSVKIVDAGFL